MLRQHAININFFQRVTDILVNLLGFVGAFYLREAVVHYYPHFKFIPGLGFYYELFVISSVLILLIGNGHNLYLSQRIRTIREELRDVVVVFSEAFVATYIVFAFFRHFTPSRSFLILFFILSVVLACLLRLIIRYLLKSIRREGLNVKHILIVGTGDHAVVFTEEIRKHPEWGLRIAGYLKIEPSDKIAAELSRAKILGQSIREFKKTLVNNVIDDVIFANHLKDFDKVSPALILCDEMGINAALNILDFNNADISVERLGQISCIKYSSQPEPSIALLIKYLLDVVAAAAALVVLVPLVFIPIAILIKLTSRGPVFFCQERVGLGNRMFKIYKFRTMIEGAEKLKAKLLAKNEHGRKSIIFKIKNDPRITPLGRFLRKTSLDELPQLINVLLGEMSIVGPRPPLPSEVEKYANIYRRRITMKPGITCIWQVSGRSEVTFEEWMKMDMEYIDNWSLWLDFIILLKTIPVVLFRKGAY